MLCYEKQSFFYVDREYLMNDNAYTKFRSLSYGNHHLEDKSPLFATSFSNEQTIFLFKTSIGWASIEILHSPKAPS